MKELIHHYGAWIVFALVFLESIGLPLPGRSDPGERCDLSPERRRSLTSLSFFSPPCLGRYSAVSSASGSAIGTDIHCCFATAPTSD